MGRIRGLRPMQLLGLTLDIAMVATVIATFAQVGDPDLLFHLVWVLLVAEAFLFGFRVAILRLGFAVLCLASYEGVATAESLRSVEFTPLELTEWPLMIVIALLVAIMADRQKTTASRFARLYRNASDRLLSAQEDERRRLARDLHDGVGQTLTAASLAIDDLQARLMAADRSTNGKPPEIKLRDESLRRARALLGLAMDETRDVAIRLRPARLQELGVVAAIVELAEHAGIPVAVNTEASLSGPGLLEPSRETELYRIVQEAVSNIARHAGPCAATVTFKLRGDQLVVEIKDNGVGFNMNRARERGLGLPGMEERARAIGATLSIRSSVGRGTTIRVTVPGIHPHPSTGGGSADVGRVLKVPTT